MKATLTAAQLEQVEHCEAGPARCPVCAKEAAQGRNTISTEELSIAYMSGLYDGKKKHPWVGLTGQEQALIASVSKDVPDAIYRANAKLKEKNT